MARRPVFPPPDDDQPQTEPDAPRALKPAAEPASETPPIADHVPQHCRAGMAHPKFIAAQQQPGQPSINPAGRPRIRGVVRALQKVAAMQAPEKLRAEVLRLFPDLDEDLLDDLSVDAFVAVRLAIKAMNGDLSAIQEYRRLRDGKDPAIPRDVEGIDAESMDDAELHAALSRAMGL